MIKGAIFDLDGTLLDSLPVWENAGALYLQSLGIQAEQNLGKILFNMNMDEGARYLQRTYSLAKTPEQIIQGVDDVVSDAYLHTIPLKAGAAQFLSDMSRAGIKIALATASDRRIVEPALQRVGISGYFSHIVTCTECSTSKSKPDIYLLCAKLLGTEPYETVVFEDALMPIKTAVSAGFKVAAVYDKRNEPEEAEIRRNCAIYIEEYGGFNENSINNRRK